MSRLKVSPEHAATGRWQSSDRHPRLAAVILGGCATTGVIVLADAAGEHDGLSRWDPVTAADVVRLRTPALTDLAQAFTFLGSEIVVGGLAILVLLTLVVRGRLTQAATFATGIAGSAFLTVTLKLLVARARPGAVDRLGTLDTSYSFPSGHTLNTAVFVALVGWLLWPAVRSGWRVGLLVGGAGLTFGVAASRVYLGYHWLTDVLASGLVAIAWLCIVWLLGSTIARAVSDVTARTSTAAG